MTDIITDCAVYEDDDILVINKPQGLIVHHGAGVTSGTLYDMLINRYGNADSHFKDECRMGIVHRLDKDTSGLMVVAKNSNSYYSLIDEFKEHRVQKEYSALCYGFFNVTEGVIDTYINRSKSDRKKFSVSKTSEGKNAITHYEVVEQFEFGRKKKQYVALLKVVIETGRTHQIRVHMSSIAHPVVNDVIYSKKKTEEISSMGLMLMSASIAFNHPVTKKTMEFRLPLDDRFIKCMSVLRSIQ